MSTVVPSPLRILVVCTANICRSPMAAALLTEAFADHDIEVEVSSAGFLFEGHPASDTATKVLRERGLDLQAHRSRVIDGPLVADADLVLTMERRHARELVLEFDNAEKVHTLKAFAEHVYKLTGAEHEPRVFGIRPLVQAAASSRAASAFLGDGHLDEVVDPHGRSARVHRKTVAEIASAVAVIATSFAIADADERAHG